MQRAGRTASNPFAPLTRWEWTTLIVAAWIIAILSLGVHDMMLTRLNIPFPLSTGVPQWAKFVDATVRVGALALFCHLARARLDCMGSVRSAALIGLLLVMLNETLRVFTVDIYLTKGWIDGRWLFTVTDSLPGALMSFLYGAAAAIIARKTMSRDRWRLMLAIFFVAAVGVSALRPALQSAAIGFEHAFGLSEPAELYQLPYSFAVYRILYSTFIEPTVAAFIMVALVWPNLPGSIARKACTFIGLVMLIRGRVVTESLFSFWVPEPLGLSFLSESQFFFETFVLATLVVLVWGSLSSRRTNTYSSF